VNCGSVLITFLQTQHKSGESHVIVRCLAQGTEHRDYLTNRGQSLPAHVADHQTRAVAYAGGRIQVTTDPRLFGRGEVDGRDPQGTDFSGQASEQDPLCRLGDPPAAVEHRQVSPADPAEEHPEHRYDHQAE
jgi:hypothetical protein